MSGVCLKQAKREDLAVRAHGYPKHPKPLDCDGVFSRWEAHRHQRLRAIVKTMLDTWTSIEGPKIIKPEALLRWHSEQNDDLGADPRLYNWQKWEDQEEG
ncbi:hypothetical protein VMCG_00960 [Cytospora schulzeri]|uniref:Uncharacterized protein n=1 Tax=Cytospora schulzeri TaxID=448051 RepID=A0A423X6Z3_9PEZI|nr:hypothetical protein VMCG_00960 [Valsa malicola]